MLLDQIFLSWNLKPTQKNLAFIILSTDEVGKERIVVMESIDPLTERALQTHPSSLSSTGIWKSQVSTVQVKP